MTFGEQFEDALGEKGVEFLVSFIHPKDYDLIFDQWVASHQGVDAIGHCNECGEGVDVEWDSEPMCADCAAKEARDEELFQMGKDQAYEAGRK